MELSERIASKVADIELSMDDAGDLLLLASEIAQLESSLAEAREEIERMREYIIEEVGIEHAPSEFGGKA